MDQLYTRILFLLNNIDCSNCCRKLRNIQLVGLKMLVYEYFYIIFISFDKGFITILQNLLRLDLVSWIVHLNNYITAHSKTIDQKNVFEIQKKASNIGSAYFCIIGYYLGKNNQIFISSSKSVCKAFHICKFVATLPR